MTKAGIESLHLKDQNVHKYKHSHSCYTPVVSLRELCLGAVKKTSEQSNVNELRNKMHSVFKVNVSLCCCSFVCLWCLATEVEGTVITLF